jgi:hypothetical protein
MDEKAEVKKIPHIYYAVSRVMEGVAAIGKNQRNRDQGFQYRGIDDVYNALHPLMAKEGIFTVPEIVESNPSQHTTAKGTLMFCEKYRVRYTVYASDGTSVSGIVEGIGKDSGDKAGNKAMAIAHKYFLLQLFCIPTEDMVDPDAETPAPTVPPKPTPKPAPKPAPEPTPDTTGEAFFPPEAVEPAQKAQKSGAVAEPDPSIPMLRGSVEEVSTKNGTTRGKAWTRYGIKISGTWHNTFSGSDAEIAEKAKEAGMEVNYQAVKNAKGYSDLKYIDDLGF